MKLIYTTLTGIIFGIGISISGMIYPAKVLNFFDLAGTWDPSLAFVMVGAIAVTLPGYRIIWKRKSPLFGNRFQIPSSSVVDKQLVGGSALFGIGWGIAGFCPGAAIPALGTGRWEVALFLAAVAAGFGIRRLVFPFSPIVQKA